MLRLCDIVKNYPTATTTVQALRGVSLAFREAEFVAILGPSGCGKTTMLNIIGGLDRYTSGDLVIGGVSTAAFDDLHWDAYRNATIGFVFQSYNLIPHLTVIENVELALALVGQKKKERRAKAVAALHRVGMGDEINKRPNQLSGGQMQRVAIARAIVNDPKIILADEPTGALDSELSVQVMNILRDISKTRLVIMVTHNAELAYQYCTRICRFKDGSLIEDTNPYDLEEEAKEEHFDLFANAEAQTDQLLGGEGEIQEYGVESEEPSIAEEITSEPLSAQDEDLNPENELEPLEEITEDELSSEAQQAGAEYGQAEDAQTAEGEQEGEPDAQEGEEQLAEGEAPLQEETDEEAPVVEALDIDDIDYKKLYTNTKLKTKSKKVRNRKREKQMKRNDSAQNPVLNRLGINSLNKRKRKQKKQMKKDRTFKPTSMSAGMAFGLSLRNLIAKRKRSFFTAFAGSIGIIGLGLVLAISNGFDVFVDNMQTEMLAGVPVGVYEYNVAVSMLDEVTSMLTKPATDPDAFPDSDKIVVDNMASSGSQAIEEILSTFFKSVTKNNLTQEFTQYMKDYKGEYAAMNVFYGTRYNLIRRYREGDGYKYVDASQMPNASAAMSIAMTILGENGLQPQYWQQLVGDEEFMRASYDVWGKYPTSKEEIVLCVDSKNTINTQLLEQFGLTFYEMDKDDQTHEIPLDELTFDDVIGKHIRLVRNDDYYIKNSNDDFYGDALDGVGTDRWYYGDQDILADIFEKSDPESGGSGLDLEITGVIRPKKDAAAAYVTAGSLCYTPALAEFVNEDAYNSQVAQFQRELQKNELYFFEMNERPVGTTVFKNNDTKMDTDISSTSITSVLANKLELTSYLKAIGAINIPTFVAVYPETYKQKIAIGEYIGEWNGIHQDEQLGYFDVSEMMVHSLNMIIDLVSVMLIAVASISLVVSTVMIGVITANSVVERTREIGILRAIGARKRDIRNVFVAETALLGLASGILGIVITYILSPLINLVIGAAVGVSSLLHFHPLHAFLLVALSLVLTVISGVAPAISASRKNVVDALRVE